MKTDSLSDIKQDLITVRNVINRCLDNFVDSNDAAQVAIYNEGRKLLFNDCTKGRYFFMPIVDKQGEVTVSYKDFVDLYIDHVPKQLSLADFCKQFDIELHVAYSRIISEQKELMVKEE